VHCGPYAQWVRRVADCTTPGDMDAQAIRRGAFITLRGAICDRIDVAMSSNAQTKNARIVAGAFASALSIDQFTRLQ